MLLLHFLYHSSAPLPVNEDLLKPLILQPYYYSYNQPFSKTIATYFLLYVGSFVVCNYSVSISSFSVTSLALPRCLQLKFFCHKFKVLFTLLNLTWRCHYHFMHLKRNSTTTTSDLPSCSFAAVRSLVPSLLFKLYFCHMSVVICTRSQSYDIEE